MEIMLHFSGLLKLNHLAQSSLTLSAQKVFAAAPRDCPVFIIIITFVIVMEKQPLEGG